MVRWRSTHIYNIASIRVVTIEGNPWFVAMDVCKALGFHVKASGDVNTTHALRHCNADEIITHRLSDGRTRPAKLISESGLYRLIMRSDKPEAKVFQDWVTKAVLPARCQRPTAQSSMSPLAVPSLTVNAEPLYAGFGSRPTDPACTCMALRKGSRSFPLSGGT